MKQLLCIVLYRRDYYNRKSIKSVLTVNAQPFAKVTLRSTLARPVGRGVLGLLTP